MALNYHGRSRINAAFPEAQGVCDRCGEWYSLRTLQDQYEFTGTQLQDLQYKVCNKCIDDPNPQNKTVILPPDPPPLYNTRTEPFTQDETDFRVTQDTDPRITQEDDNRIVE